MRIFRAVMHSCMLPGQRWTRIRPLAQASNRKGAIRSAPPEGISRRLISDKSLTADQYGQR